MIISSTVGVKNIIWTQDGKILGGFDLSILQNVNLSKLGEKLGIDRTYLSKIKHGHIQPTIKLWDRIEKLLKT